MLLARGKTLSRDSHDQTRVQPMPDHCNFAPTRFNFSQVRQKQLKEQKWKPSGRDLSVAPRAEHLFNAVFIYNPNITRKLRQRRPNWPADLQHTRSLSSSFTLPPRWKEPSNVKCHQLVSVSPTIFSISPIVSGCSRGRPPFLHMPRGGEERRSRVNRADIDSPGSVARS